ncbi:MAG: hypothetical protein JXL97_09000 [Bacteroidales bacterium]|nr:hypothetical protein [Bacteroidales bacterium]
MNLILWILTGILLIFSFFKNKEKTFFALKIATQKFLNILPLFLVVMAFFALIVTYISPEIMQKYIGKDSGIQGIATSLGLGSIAVMPGFAAFPLCGALKLQGIPFYILAAFTISLMNVGIVSFPLEAKFLGVKVAFIRNILALTVSIIAVIIVKIVFNE